MKVEEPSIEKSHPFKTGNIFLTYNCTKYPEVNLKQNGHPPNPTTFCLLNRYFLKKRGYTIT